MSEQQRAPETVEEMAADLHKRILEAIQSCPRVENSFAGEKMIAKAIVDRCEELAPGEIKVTVEPYPDVTDDDKKFKAEMQRSRTSVPINLEMSRETYDRVFVPMGYAPIPPMISVTVEVQR
jgi:hypothetical protein